MAEALCGKYLGDNDGTCPQLTCIRTKGHEGLCDNVRGDEPTCGCWPFHEPYCDEMTGPVEQRRERAKR